MGNINDSYILAFQLSHYLEKRLYLMIGEGTGRLVHNNHPAVLGYRPDDFHHLLCPVI